ncbi:MAG: hypothetical protein HOJ57_13885 [Lentisphaerae bacterium]|jgi:protein-tyrosine phosphatase|nr:hypothetical protein [Lentisphaerota bacterium]MBT5607026.1 hypothetical protein [Lentisphaerota bacterium]MBT7055780.1 hypothetical protein [Lentisphaerota bacterium]
MIDLHCHLLPGLDDGPRTLVEALDMCVMAAADGTTVVAATPHQMDGLHNVCSDDISRGIDELQRHVDQRGIALQIVPGGEVHLACCPGWELALGGAMTLGNTGRYVLVEPSGAALPPILRDALARIRGDGVTPIIGHPERNPVFRNCPEFLCSLVADGNLAQVTAGSLTGLFGGKTQGVALDWVERRLIHLVATDAHSPVWRMPILSEAKPALLSVLPADDVDEILDERPKRILAGEHIDIPRPLERKRGWLRRLTLRVQGLRCARRGGASVLARK